MLPVRVWSAVCAGAAMALVLAGCSGSKPAGGDALTRETPALQRTAKGAATALADGDAGALAELCAPDVRERYRTMLTEYPEAFSDLATALRSATPTVVAEPPDGADPNLMQFAEISFVMDGRTFYAQMEKVGGAWQFVEL